MPRQITFRVYHKKSAKISDNSNESMPSVIQEFAVQISHEAFANQSDRYIRAKYIREKFESKYGYAHLL